jgi:hypothetical protein
MSSLVTRTAQGQPSMPESPPLQRDNARASEADIRSQTGHSGPISGSHTKHVRHTVEGDHRQANLHSGRDNASAVPRIQAGKPIQNIPMRNGGDDDGPQAA